MKQFIINDSVLGLKSINSESIDLSVYSPVYKNEDGFLNIDFDEFFKEMYRVHKNNTWSFLNFGHLKDYKDRPLRLALKALEHGWGLNDTITWIKPQYSPTQGNKRLNNVTEFIFLLYKGEPTMDRMAIGVPYEDASNATRYNKGQNLKCRGNAWRVKYETITNKEQKLHNLRMPLELAELCVKLSGVKTGTVLDPCCGSGTTGIAALKYDLNFIGIDHNPVYKEVFEKRIKDAGI